MEVQRIENCFAETHLIRALKFLKDASPCRFTERALELVEHDVTLLYESVVGAFIPPRGEVGAAGYTGDDSVGA